MALLQMHYFLSMQPGKKKIKLDVPDSEKETISKLVGSSAIKFALLKTSSDKKITFKWEEALSLEGDSGPYAQYAYVRTNGILGKTKEKPEVTIAEFNNSEKELIKKLAQLSVVVSRCSKELAPHHLSQYSLEVAAGFSSFYANSHVLNEENEKIRKSRLAITLGTCNCSQKFSFSSWNRLPEADVQFIFLSALELFSYPF